MKTIYRANDGREFLIKQDCQKYEKELKKCKIRSAQMVEFAKAISDYCRSCGDMYTCKDCPFNADGTCKLNLGTGKYPSEWEV